MARKQTSQKKKQNSSKSLSIKKDISKEEVVVCKHFIRTGDQSITNVQTDRKNDITKPPNKPRRQERSSEKASNTATTEKSRQRVSRKRKTEDSLGIETKEKVRVTGAKQKNVKDGNDFVESADVGSEFSSIIKPAIPELTKTASMENIKSDTKSRTRKKKETSPIEDTHVLDGKTDEVTEESDDSEDEWEEVPAEDCKPLIKEVSMKQITKKKSLKQQNISNQKDDSAEEKVVSGYFIKTEAEGMDKKDSIEHTDGNDDMEDFMPDNPNRQKTKSGDSSLSSKIGKASKREQRKRKSEGTIEVIGGQKKVKIVGKERKKSQNKKDSKDKLVKEKVKLENEDTSGEVEICKVKATRKTETTVTAKSKKAKKEEAELVKESSVIKKPRENGADTKKPYSKKDPKRKNSQKGDKLPKRNLSENFDNIEEEKKMTKGGPSAKPVNSTPVNINSSDIMSVLMHMEGPSTSRGHAKVMDDDHDDEMMSDSDTEEGVKEDAESSSDDEDEWEEVEDHHGDSPKKSQTPGKSVEITLEAPVIYKKRKKKEFNLQDYLKKQMNKFKRELALDIHKVHLLCLLYRGLYLNSVCQGDTLRAQVMSVVMTTREIIHPPVKTHSQDHVRHVLKWLNTEFKVTDSQSSTKENMEKHLTDCLEKRTLEDTTDFTLVCIMVLRHLGFITRLVMSLQPLPYKQAQIIGSKSSSKVKKVKPKTEKSKSGTTKPSSASKSKGKVSKRQTPSKSKEEKVTVEKDVAKDQTELVTVKRTKRRCSKTLSKGAYKEQDNIDVDDDDDDDENDVNFVNTEESDSDSGCENTKHKKGKKKGAGKKNALGKKPAENKKVQEASSDSDFEEESIIMRTQSLKKEPSKTRNQRVLSSDSDSSPIHDKNTQGSDVWLEVYIEAENTWISVCSKDREITKPTVIRSHATPPVYYVIGVDNKNAVRDVTIRYASEWLTKTRKLRVEEDWWLETLEPYVSEDKDRDAVEDKEMQAYLLQRPLPSSIAQFKGHPLYILKRHLLKYEALYPNSIVPLGYVRGEPVYSRDCCHTLHSRENWLKEGRSVRLGEEPYKYVKSRKRWNDKDSEPKNCELFGKWQTEIYIPPPAVDGVVPRNAHGNVEMFQPWMLPAGTVHLKGLPALNRIARKLDIDCAQAMVGWDHHCGFAHPVMDGWIVCEEHKDILLAAWDEEQEIIQEREKEKREKRVYDNWKKLIRGLLIRERLKKRYDLEENLTSTATTEVKDEEMNETGEKATDVQHSWPQNRLTKSKKAVGVVETL